MFSDNAAAAANAENGVAQAKPMEKATLVNVRRAIQIASRDFSVEVEGDGTMGFS